MPIYEFICKKCNKKYERLCKIDTTTDKCSICNSITNKIISPSSFILKGNGWSKDNYGLLTKQNKKEKKT